jgi:hypothetical protein
MMVVRPKHVAMYIYVIYHHTILKLRRRIKTHIRCDVESIYREMPFPTSAEFALMFECAYQCVMAVFVITPKRMYGFNKTNYEYQATSPLRNLPS